MSFVVNFKKNSKLHNLSNPTLYLCPNFFLSSIEILGHTLNSLCNCGFEINKDKNKLYNLYFDSYYSETKVCQYIKNSNHL